MVAVLLASILLMGVGMIRGRGQAFEDLIGRLRDDTVEAYEVLSKDMPAIGSSTPVVGRLYGIVIVALHLLFCSAYIVGLACGTFFDSPEDTVTYIKQSLSDKKADDPKAEESKSRGAEAPATRCDCEIDGTIEVFEDD